MLFHQNLGRPPGVVPNTHCALGGLGAETWKNHNELQRQDWYSDIYQPAAFLRQLPDKEMLQQ
jgi:hypothetical protein